jgi:hypothetical protein
MSKSQKEKQNDAPPSTPIAFDDALRKILKAPPQHKSAPKGKKKPG